MLLVIDANVLCTALLAKGKTVDLLFSDNLEAIAPERLFIEVEKHIQDLVKRSALSLEEIEDVFSGLKKKIRVIGLKEFADFFPEAKKLLGDHVKDVEYVALALKMRCPLWSKEKRLKGIDAITTLDADEVERKLFSSP